MRFISALIVCAALLINPMSAAQVLAQSSHDQASRVLDISVRSIDGRISAAVTFSTKVQGSVDLDPWLSIETIAGDRVEGSWILDEKAKTLYFTNIEPEQNYLVTVAAGLPLANQQFLLLGSSEKIEVAAISPMLGFAGNGNLLAGSLSDGLPVIAVNVPQVDVDFYRIPESQLVSFLSENSRRGQLDFWQVEEYIDNFELAYTARFDLKLAPNQTATSYLPIKSIAALRHQGVYLAVMRKSGEYRYSYPSTWFAISDLGVHLRIYRDRADVTVSSLASAEPISQVQLTLLDDNGQQIAQRSSNDTGFASFSQTQLDKAQLLLAVSGSQTSIVRLFGPVLDLSEFPVSGIVDSPRQLFFYSQRDLYRPGEALTISALLRDSDGKLLPPQVLTFKLKRPDGRIASEQRLSANVLGYYASHWQLPKDAPTGQWSVTAQLAGQAATSYVLQVEEFLPERMELILETPEFVATAAPYQVSVTGKYLYGAPASGNLLQSELVTKIAAHPFKAFNDFYFSNPQISDFNRRISLDDASLDLQGKLNIAPDSFWKKAPTPLQLKVYASLLDAGGRPVSRIASSFALPAQQLVGIRPMFAEDTAPYDSNANFQLLLTDGAAKLGAENLSVKLIREQRNYHWLYTQSEGWTSDYTERHYTVSNTQISIAAGEVASGSQPVGWGHYRLEVTNPETNIVSGYKFRAGWNADETVLAGRPDRIGLALNKQRYTVGDRVEV
ncbi:MAG: MG2 domain-containing protein, partial [Pseudomonadales bacterium]|nr:MG2 domain-containing protein [Pseudomonadales bacterium]